MSVNRGIIVDRELSSRRHKGVNSTELAEKIVRERVFDSLYWKLNCFNVNAATILNRCVELRCVGSFEQSGRPFPFLCLFVKLIQMLPPSEIIEFYLEQHEFKYLKVLALLYVRIVERDQDTLRQHLSDYRKIILFENGAWTLTTVDVIVDRLLTEDFFIGLTLPFMGASE